MGFPMFSVLIPVAILIGLFMAGRWVVLWYWKINRIVEHLASIDESLRQLPAVRDYDRQLARRPPRAA